jgi:hypothetical protein
MAKFGKIGLAKGRAVTDDKDAFTFVDIFQSSEPANTLAPPGMKISGRQFRDSLNRIVRAAREPP